MIDNLHTSINSFEYGKVTGAIVIDLRREKKDGKFPAKYRVTYQRKQRYFDSGFSFSIKEWERMPKTKDRDLLEIRKMLYNGNKIIEQHIKDLVLADSFSFDLLSKKMSKGDNSSINVAYDRKIKAMRANDQVGTAMIYDCAIKSMTDFNKNKEMFFTRVNVDWLRKYEKWFIDSGNSYATLSMYLRTLRAIFNEAQENGDIPNTSYPFGKRRYEIPTGAGRKMALDLQQIKKIVDFEVEPGSTTEKMKDLFLFSYMGNGINIKDLISLKWKNLSDNEISYFREKTKRTTTNKQKIVIPVLPEMKNIIEKWGNGNRDPEGYMFGYLEGSATADKVRLVSQNLTRLMNKHLKKIAQAVGLPGVSTYTARHSFSTILLNAGASVEFISEALGHSDISTTKAYLSGFQSDIRKKMNSNLLNFSTDEPT